MNFIKLVGTIVAFLILLCWLAATIWLLCLAMIFGNIAAIILTIVLIILLSINLALYYKEEVEENE